MFVFNHPVEACYESRSNEPSEHEWPRIEIEVRWRDEHGRSDLGGYAVVHVPNAPGMHEVSCRVWRPRGGLFERIAAFFVGGYPQLKENALVYGISQDAESGNANSTRLVRHAGRNRLQTVPGGVVHLTLGIVHHVSVGGDGDE